ncbi:hypothetical protein MTO96_029296 [Rhipicephalus appendiculatus]
MTADRNCRARYKTPYIVTKRQWERRRAAEEAAAAATADPAASPAQDPGPPVDATPDLGAAHRGPGSSYNAGLAAEHLERPQRGTPRPLSR